MLWQFCADVHGAHGRFEKAIDPDLPVALLGDNLNLVDFKTLSGVASRVLRKRDIARILLALSTGGPKAARRVADLVFFENPEAIARARIEIRKEYKQLLDSLPPQAIVLHGNVDWPDLLSEALGERYIEAEVRDIGGRRVGFLSGTGSYPFSSGLPGETSDEAYAEALWSLGAVDILCTHFPPAIDELIWDVVAKRSEGGGSMISEYILETKPRLHMFGHIHNPKLDHGKLGETLLLNVGGFRARGEITLLEMDDLSYERR